MVFLAWMNLAAPLAGKSSPRARGFSRRVYRRRVHVTSATLATSSGARPNPGGASGVRSGAHLIEQLPREVKVLRIRDKGADLASTEEAMGIPAPGAAFDESGTPSRLITSAWGSWGAWRGQTHPPGLSYPSRLGGRGSGRSFWVWAPKRHLVTEGCHTSISLGI